MTQGTTRSQWALTNWFTGKNLVPDCKNLAYCKGNQWNKKKTKAETNDAIQFFNQKKKKKNYKKKQIQVIQKHFQLQWKLPAIRKKIRDVASKPTKHKQANIRPSIFWNWLSCL